MTPTLTETCPNCKAERIGVAEGRAYFKCGGKCGDQGPLRLNLGSSDSRIPGFRSVDIVQPCDDLVDLSGPWPWADSTVDEIRAHDILEHLKDPIHVMNEIHRVLKPGCRLDLFIPTTNGRGAWQDLTHASWWSSDNLIVMCEQVVQEWRKERAGLQINANSLFYLSDQFAEWRRFRHAYGITAQFDIVTTGDRLTWPIEDVVWTGDMALMQESPLHILFSDNVWKLKVFLEAVK